jgi:carbamate kinase
MGPKVDAACRYVERTGGLAVIASLEAAVAAVHGAAGTRIRP